MEYLQSVVMLEKLVNALINQDATLLYLRSHLIRRYSVVARALDTLPVGTSRIS